MPCIFVNDYAKVNTALDFFPFVVFGILKIKAPQSAVCMSWAYKQQKIIFVVFFASKISETPSVTIVTPKEPM